MLGTAVVSSSSTFQVLVGSGPLHKAACIQPLLSQHLDREFRMALGHLLFEQAASWGYVIMLVAIGQ